MAADCVPGDDRNQVAKIGADCCSRCDGCERDCGPDHGGVDGNGQKSDDERGVYWKVVST